MPPFHFIVCEPQEMSGFRQWVWVMVSKRWRAPVNVHSLLSLTCVHPVWAPMNAAKHDWTSCNRDKVFGFCTNAETELPLDQSWSYCCHKWAQLSVSWRTTAVIPWKWKQNHQILWRLPVVLKLAVSRQFPYPEPVVIQWQSSVPRT